VIDLRPYQSVSIESVRAQLRAGKRRPILVLPTGGGKTLTAASILISAMSKGRRVMFAAHRKELIDQTVRAFERLGVTDIGVVRAQDRRFRPGAMCQIASVQTLVRRKPIPNVDVVVIDECHRALAKSYAQALFMAYPGATFLGLTATPCGPNGKALGASFDALVVGATYSTLIAEGHIVEPIVFSTPTQADLSDVRTTGGDYNLEDLEKAVNRGSLIGNIVAEWSKHAGSLKTVVFAVSVLHSRAITERFVAAGIAAEHLDGETPEDERAAILGRLERGETRVLSNVGVLCEGWDMPSVKGCVLACPTKSLVKFMQCAGRVLRPSGGVRPIILDHAGNIDRHGMPHEDREWSLDAKPKRKGGGAPMKSCESCYAYVPAGSRVCPHCGAEFAVVVKPEPKGLDDVGLAERTREQMVRETVLPASFDSIEGDPRSVGVFESLVRRMYALKYKPQWVRYRFEAAVKRPLPREWAQRIGA
jgi:superfamily II DNA or RNA helicase